MKKVKIAIWVLIAAFFAILIYQNKDLFMAQNTLTLDLAFLKYQIPEMRILMLCFLFLLVGLLFGVYFLVVYTLKTKKLIKAANTRITSQDQKIADLENELVRYRGQPPPVSTETAEADDKTVVINS
jgi:hypothetical protein